MLTDKEREILQVTNAYAQRYYFDALAAGSIKRGGHFLDHGRRVAGISRIIALGEEQNSFLPILAGIIHDLGRAKTDDPRSMNSQHGILSIEIARDFIEDLPLGRDEKELIIMAVQDHPFLNHAVRQNDVVKVLQDADRCDGLGPLAVVKVTSFWPQFPLHPEHVCQELPYKPGEDMMAGFRSHREWFDMLWTKTAKEMVRDDVNFFDEYIARYEIQIRKYQDAYRDIWDVEKQ